MLRIKEIASQANMNPSAIRYYEQIGILPAPKRAENGYRIYDEQDLDRLSFITRARELDFSLEEIGEIIGLREHGDAPCAYVIEQISLKIHEVDRKIATLTQLKAELAQLERKATELPLAEIEARSCVCHLIENQQPSIED